MSEWRDIPGFEGRYQASDCGQIRGFYRGRWRVMSQYVGKSGYSQIGLWEDGRQKQKTVHSLVAAAFLGHRAEGLVVCHFNGVRADNRAANLRYDTPSANQQDRQRHATHCQGSANPIAKLCEREVEEIKAKRGTATYRSIAGAYGVSFATIQKIMSGNGWRHVS